MSGYGTTFLVGGVLQLAAVPFLLLSRRQRAAADSSTAPAAGKGPAAT